VERARDAEGLARLIDAEPRLMDREVVEELGDEVSRAVHVDLDRAERLADAAAAIAARLADEHAQARSTRARASVRWARGDYAAAANLYAEAAAAFERRGDEVQVARTLSSSIQPLVYLGRYEEALSAAERARAVFERTGDRVRLGRLDLNVANVHYRLDRFPEALELYRQAYEELLRYGEPQDVGVALRNIAVCYISLNRFAEALQAYHDARAYAEEHGLSLLVVMADYNIAYLYYLRGEYTRAIELYQLARERSDRLGDPYHAALCDLDQAELYLELNLIAEGARLAERAFAGFERLGMGYEAAKALANLGIACGRDGKVFRAIELFEQARRIFEREGNEVWAALIDAYRAVVLQHEGRHFEARRQAELALAVFERRELQSKAALCELVLARTHCALGELVSARRCCLEALERLARLDEPSLTYRAYLLLGQAEEALANRAAAVAAYEEAHARLENLRSHLEQDEMKVGFLKDKLVVYESLVWMELTAPGGGDLERAHAFVEQAKSRGLADLMAFRAHALPARDPARSGIAAEIHDLRRELNWYYRKIDLAELSPERSASEVETLRRESREREAGLLRALRDLRQRDAEFASLQAAGAIGLSEIRSTLPPDALILEYYEARHTIFAIVLGHARLEIVPLTPVSRVKHLLRLLQFQLAKFRLGPDYARSFAPALVAAARAHLQQLYAELIAPVRALLQGEHLIVVPHGFLHYVPFHALFDGRGYLVDEFAVSYAPSASVHHLCRLKRPYGEISLVLGVPDEAAPYIQQEAETVAAQLPASQLFLGSAATEDVLRDKGPRSRYVHIATHGLFRYDNPMFSSLQLGDSRLSLFDLYQLDLSAELVTLSGCGTGLNVVEGGDELMGLVRGLLYAGAQAALVTLWDVHDESTATFMRELYPRLLRAPNKAEAVQAAMKRLREEYEHPYYWAPFVLVGAAQRA
jgi:CHAT domain-containing protein